ncbi:MAG: winged helix-turn-helix domain-containing protein [Nitrospirota bacterium]
MLIKPKYRSHEHVRELENLLIKSDSENNLRLWKRAKGVLLYLKNKKPDEISDLLDVGLKSIYRWLNQYNGEGTKGLYEGNHTGRPSLLTGEELTRLEDILDSGPVAYGLTTGIWTCPTVQHIIENEFGISYHHDHVRKILHNIGFSVQRPTKKLALAKPELQQKWVRKTYPILKKTAKK